MDLMAGSHNYTFECMVPCLLPASFEGKYGHIRYKARVFVQKLLWPDKKFEIPLTIINEIDLNTDPTLRDPVLSETSKTFHPCFLLICATSDSLKIVGRTIIGGYVPGQTIDLVLNVINRSNQLVSEFTVQFIEEYDFFIHKDKLSHIKEKIVIAQEYARGCDSNREDDLKVNIKIPFSTKIDNKICNIIKVHHFIRVMASVSLCQSDPEIRLPIIIGSYPISNNYVT